MSRHQRTGELDMTIKSPLADLYNSGLVPGYQEPVFSSGRLDPSDSSPAQPVPEEEEGELTGSKPDMPQKTEPSVSEDQSYWEIIRGIRAYMNWNFVPDLELSGATAKDNPFKGTRSQPVGKVSVQLPVDDWFCHKWEAMTQTEYQNHFLRPPKSQLHWYGLHPVNPAVSRPARQVSFWGSDATKLNTRVSKPSGSGFVLPPCRPLSQETVQKWQKAMKQSPYVCNHAAGFTRCMTKLQEDIQVNVCIL